MATWLIPANEKMFDFKQAFLDMGVIDWTQSANYDINDIVYIYCSAPYKRIMYKTEVKKANIAYNEMVDDSAYWKDMTAFSNVKERTFVRLVLLKHIDTEKLSLIELQEHGLKMAPRGPQKVPAELQNYIEKYINDDYPGEDSPELPSAKKSNSGVDGIVNHTWTIEEKELAEVLLKAVNNNESLIYYSEVSERMPSHPNPHFGLTDPLYHLGLLCHHLGLPFISAIVIKKGEKEPGSGLRPVFAECGRDVPELSSKELFKLEQKAIYSCNKWHMLADFLDIDIEMLPKGETIHPDEIQEEERQYVEGKAKTVTVNQYERDSIARRECIEYYAKNGRICCQICGFDFGTFYGEDYANIIEVHHIKPLASIGKSYKVNPKKDLIPVCPNCHTVLHSKVGESVEDLKKRLSKD